MPFQRMRAARVILYLAAALVLALGGWLIPSYLRALDPAVVRHIGSQGPSLGDTAAALLRAERLGEAEMLLETARAVRAPETEKLARLIRLFRERNPSLARYGAPSPYLKLIEERTGPLTSKSHPSVVDILLPEAGRRAALDLLRGSRKPIVQELLKNRYLTHTRLFPPVASKSGQALDTAILITALLAQADRLNPTLRDEIEATAAAANRGRDPGPLEAMYLDILGAGRVMNWGQLTAWAGLIPDLRTLRELSHFALRDPNNRSRLAVVFATALMAGSAGETADYLRRFREDGLRYLKEAAAAGPDGVRAVLARKVRLYAPPERDRLVAATPLLEGIFGLLVRFAAALPLLALAAKYWLWLDASFCLARGLAKLFESPEERANLSLRLIRFQQQLVAASVILMLAIILAEPYLGAGNTPGQTPQGWSFPKVKLTIGDKVNEAIKPVMTEVSWIALVVFLVIQAALYIISLIKLKEIKRQNLPPSVKLKLLDNEEHMFDAGLYVGLGGTVLSLVFLVLKLFNPGLIVAYSSTLFGIFFVSLLKICHVRPYRRALILESESASVGL